MCMYMYTYALPCLCEIMKWTMKACKQSIHFFCAQSIDLMTNSKDNLYSRAIFFSSFWKVWCDRQFFFFCGALHWCGSEGRKALMIRTSTGHPQSHTHVWVVMVVDSVVACVWGYVTTRMRHCLLAHNTHNARGTRTYAQRTYFFAMCGDNEAHEDMWCDIYCTG